MTALARSEASQQLGMRAPVEVEMIRRGDFERPSGRRFGSLVHAILASVDLDAESDAIQASAAVNGRFVGATEEEIIAAIATVRATLEHPILRRAAASARKGGLIDSWCKSPSYNGIIRARSNSTPARPYMARLRVFSLLICPSVCPLLQGSDIAFRTASRSWRIVFAKRCIA